MHLQLDVPSLQPPKAREAEAGPSDALGVSWWQCLAQQAQEEEPRCKDEAESCVQRQSPTEKWRNLYTWGKAQHIKGTEHLPCHSLQLSGPTSATIVPPPLRSNFVHTPNASNLTRDVQQCTCIYLLAFIVFNGGVLKEAYNAFPNSSSQVLARNQTCLASAW